MVWQGESLVVQENYYKKLNTIFILIVFSFLAIILRFFYLQILRGNYFYDISEKNSTQLFIERAPRGIIYDHKYNVLCDNKPVSMVLYYPFLKDKPAELKKDLLEKLEKILPGSEKVLMEGYNKEKVICLAEGIPRDVMFKLLEQKTDLTNISVITEMRRQYPYGKILSHVLGYIGEIDKKELEDPRYIGHKQTDIIGKTGLEKEYDSYIIGQDGGWIIESDVSGKQLSILDRIQPIPGDNMQLTIDIDLQRVAEEALEDTGHSGAIIGLDPNNGSVRIFVSQPEFDPNLFESCSPERLKYFNNKKLPLYNRVLQGEYPPGSIFKVITSAAALNEHKISVDTEFYCPGYFRLGKKNFNCWDLKGHKSMNFYPGMKYSCDVYFYNTGLRTGINLLVDYSQKFNLGSLTGIDLPAERRGFIPDAKWRKTKLRYGWLDGDTVNFSIGQGYLTVTPIQAACMISAVASRGSMWKPFIVKRVISNDGVVVFKNDPVKLNYIELEGCVWDSIQKALVGVVEGGTGGSAYVPGMKIAGKTGTSQNPHGEDHAWFVAYGPAENPRLALAILVEHGGKGGAVAAPLAAKIFTELKRIEGL